MSRLLTPRQDSILSYATCTPRPQGLKMMMKSRDILSPDIVPGIRTQDSVVMMMIAFITIKSSLVLLIEGLCAQ